MSENDMNMLLMAFEKLRAQNTDTMREAESLIQEYMHVPDCITSFFNVIMKSEVPVVGLVHRCVIV